MKNFKIDHKNFSFDVTFEHHLSQHKNRLFYIIGKINLEELYASLVTDISNPRRVKHTLVKLRNTPHFAFIHEKRKDYLQYLKKFGEFVGQGIHSEKKFQKLISNKYQYLEGIYASNYIICERVNNLFSHKNIIIDGLHKACILLSQGAKIVPVAFLLNERSKKFAQYDQYLNDYRGDFLEWYTPVEIRGRIIHERTYPNFKPRTNFLINNERGKSKWDYIIKKNLPSLKGKTVCDLGCNIGLYSIFMAQMGAIRVDGFDRGENVVQPTNKNLPRQNVVQQAYFVKNLFELAGKHNLNIVNYIECDINKMDFSKLKYDLLFSCCVLYHFGKNKFDEFIKKTSRNIPEIFLQTNLGHTGDELSELVSVEFQKSLLEKYGYKVKVIAPANYNYPVLYGKK